MKTTVLSFTAVALVALAAGSASAWADARHDASDARARQEQRHDKRHEPRDEQRHRARDDARRDVQAPVSTSRSPGVQAVPNAAAAGEPGYAWRYFSDPVAAQAVVISPQGAYYYSSGDGLALVAQVPPVAN